MRLRTWLESKPFTLALSSTFFGFYAHCGVAAALYRKKLIPAKITGSSAGALVGGALASGLEPEEMRDILFALSRKDFWDPFPGPGYLRGKKFRQVLQRHFVPTFDRAHIPLEVAAFDLFSLRTRFLKEGSLPTAVVASCAVPLLFHPVRIGRKLYVDGGVFHKSGINLATPRERILGIYIQGEGKSAAYEWRQSLSGLGRNQKLLRFEGLPSVSYNSLSAGRLAYQEAYERTLQALERPMLGVGKA